MVDKCRFLVLLCVVGSAHLNAVADESVDYSKQIKPLLKERCFACHGGLKQQAGLRLDTVPLMEQGGDSGAAMTRGNPDESLIVARVSATEIAERMPPEQEGEPFTPEEVTLLKQWIAAGASAPTDEIPESDPREHWSFRPRVRPEVPTGDNATWRGPVSHPSFSSNPMDAFVALEHHRHGLVPQGEPLRALLVRRLYFDLIGLPPLPEDIAAATADSSPEWYEKLVDKLLADPRHGERWGRHWMDVWRYSDWWGLGDQLRNSQKHIWHWRDWIVESLNADTPYDEMVRQMLAGDELYPNDLSKLRATGYLARNYFLFNRNQWLEETVEHVGKGFLGLTMNCAKCHDHKYDPIEQADFYALRACFEPYHVRTDILPGESDLIRDGIPRPYDGLLDTSTYLFVRGQENNPDKSKPILPGVPKIFSFADFAVTSVTLPAEAYEPERRPWVLDGYIASARKNVVDANSILAAATKKLDGAKQHQSEQLATAATTQKTEKKDEVPAIRDPFEALDEDRWQIRGGSWSHENGGVTQKQDGPSNALLRLTSLPPTDFDATLRFTIVGGSQWRSVGISFDVIDDTMNEAAVDSQSEVSVYISAHAGGPKVQAAFRRDKIWHYPADGMRPLSIQTGHEYVLRVQTRGTLVNVTLDGEAVLAWRSPMERQPTGSLQLMTFDAQAQFREFSLKPLPSDIALREPDDKPTPSAGDAVAEAQAEWNVAKCGADSAAVALASVERRADALRAKWSGNVAADSGKEKARMAARSERELAVAKARQGVADLELKLLRAASDKRGAIEKELDAAKKAVEETARKVDEPSEAFTKFIGAAWTPTRFLSSTADDPNVPFPPTSTGRRSALATWITSPDNPLTARVAANHIWMRHMGAPLVPTTFELGRNGLPPTHPELLDWLASELVVSGWSMKHLHKLIVTSASYRMSSSISGGEANIAKDPDNRWLWRRNPIRLEAQVVRDAILRLDGTLDPTMGGPPVPAADQAASTRRSLYFFHSNNERNLLLTTFDDAGVKECYQRDQSIVPQQALALANGQLVLDAANRIAKHLSEADAMSDEAFIQRAFLYVLAFPPNDAEMGACTAALAKWRQLPEKSNPDATDPARVHLIWTLLNHNDFVTLR